VASESNVILGVTGDIGSVVARHFAQIASQVIAPTSRQLDLTDGDAVESFFHRLRLDYGLFFAAFVDRRRGELPVHFEANARMVSNVVAYARPMWMTFCSSIIVYGENPELPISEISPLAGEGLYARAKIAAEMEIQAAADGRYPALTMRLPGVFGGMGPRNQSFDRILSTGLRDGQISLGPNGTVLRDWVSAWEVAEFLALYDSSPRAGLINFVRGESIPIDDYVAKAIEVVDGVRHLRDRSGASASVADFKFDAKVLRAMFPTWRFPVRSRDVYRVARELAAHKH
jgi:nucleoside-diphosphate-sugar epimerase